MQSLSKGTVNTNIHLLAGGKEKSFISEDCQGEFTRKDVLLKHQRVLQRRKKRLKRFVQLVGKNLAKHQTQALSGDFQHMHLTKCTHECAMCIFLFLKIFNFIKEIVHIYIVFFKKVKTIVFVLNLLTCSNIYNF